MYVLCINLNQSIFFLRPFYLISSKLYYNLNICLTSTAMKVIIRRWMTQKMTMRTCLHFDWLRCASLVAHPYLRCILLVFCITIWLLSWYISSKFVNTCWFTCLVEHHLTWLPRIHPFVATWELEKVLNRLLCATVYYISYLRRSFASKVQHEAFFFCFLVGCIFRTAWCHVSLINHGNNRSILFVSGMYF